MDWINRAAVWLQSWLSPDAGLWGLFASAFASATVLPGSSEVVLSALVTAYPHLVWWAFFVALGGNLLGAVLTFGMGVAGRQGFERFKRVRVDVERPLVQRLRRVGPPALVLSVLPLVGDALVLAAGWFRMPFWQSLFWIAIGKGLRYGLLLAGLLGLLSIGT
ncbi:MAG: VTT domain-containing protein [Rubrivivax sp.]|nr:VTT domain-containing protein [Rubrivivax sp.]